MRCKNNCQLHKLQHLRTGDSLGFQDNWWDIYIQFFFEIFKRSSQKRNHLIRCLGFCNRPSRPLTHLSFYERGKTCFLFQSTWCEQENLCPTFLYLQLINILIKVLKLFIIFQLMKTLLLVGVAKITGDTRKKTMKWCLGKIGTQFSAGNGTESVAPEAPGNWTPFISIILHTLTLILL